MAKEESNYNFNTFMIFMVQYLFFYHEGHEEREDMKESQLIILEIMR